MFIQNKTNKAVQLALAFGTASLLAMPAAFAEVNENEEAEEARPERIQVVGSRIRTDGFESATPIEIITTEIATTQGLGTLGELLRTATIASGSNQLVSAMSVGGVTAGGAGAESISMRGLGANRTLVLLNGRRAGPAGTRGEVAAFDMNALPVSIVERVEIMKDGGSSLYGSDAVAGVINIITKRGDDSSINFSTNRPLESGGEEYRFNATLGKTFDRGSMRVAADYDVQRFLKRGQRAHLECRQRYFFDAETGERADPIDPRTGEFHCNDLPYGMWLWNAGAGNYRATINSFDYDGLHAAAGRDPYTAVNPGDISTPTGWYPVGFDKESDGWLDASHPFQNLRTMIPKRERASVYGQFNFDVSDNIQFYSELLHTRRQTTIENYRQFWEPFIPAWAGVVDGWDGWVFLDPTTVTDHSGSVTTINYTRGVMGFEGSLGDWDWDISYQRSLNRGNYDTKIILRDALEMASDALWGDPCQGAFSPISNRPCYEVPFFDPEYLRGNHTQGTKDFLFDTEYGRTVYKQDTLEAYITGDIFELPAGFISTAVGFSLQSDEIKDTPGEATMANNSWGMTGAGITEGSSRTRAIFAEFRMPLLRDLPLVEELEFTGSGRWTDVSTYGSGNTYKLQLNWDIAHGFRMRASRGTSFRAPALFELFLQEQTGFISQTNDPCWNWGARDDDGTINPIVAQNCAADGIPRDYALNFGSATTITSGGAGVLSAETSVSKTLGLVFTSPEDVFAASVDYYNYVIDGQISNIGGADVLSLCYTSENFATEPFCNQIVRNDGTAGNFNIRTISGGYTNISEQVARGADIALTYRDDTPFGRLSISLNHNVQFERSFKRLPDSDPVESVGRLGNPKHSGTLNTTLRRDNSRYTWSIRYYGKVDDYDRFVNGNSTTYRGTPVTFVAEGPTTIYHTAAYSTEMDNGFDVTLGVANVFDKKPPLGSPSALGFSAGNSLLYSQYDQLGRRVFLNLTYNF